MSARVREIARDALKMSEVDLNDFFGEKSTDKVVQVHLIISNLFYYF